MAALTITASDVLPTATSILESGTAGAAIEAGEPIYYDEVTSTYKPTLATSVTASQAVGLAINTAATGQPVDFAKEGDVTVSAVMTIGEVYVVGASTAGDLNPVADLISTNYVTVVGVATSTSNLKLRFIASTAQKP